MSVDKIAEFALQIFRKVNYLLLANAQLTLSYLCKRS